MRRGAAKLLAPVLAAVVWSGCASAPSVPQASPEPFLPRRSSVERARRLLDSGVQFQTTGRYAQSQQALSAALSELSLLDTAGASAETRSLAQSVLGAMRNNLPYSLESEILEDPEFPDEDDGVAILDSVESDSAAMAPLDSASAAELRKEFLADSGQTFDIPVEINDLVLMHLRIFKERVPQHFARWLERKGRWEAYIVQELQAHGMPKDLLYLAMIESGFNTRATSPAAAAGIWQFIPGTGRRFGLRIDRYVDERRDPRKSTQAAIAYLGLLYQQFGDWRLAMAAYNCGENCVDRSIRRSGTNDYWRVPLPRETRNYVPRIFAAAILAKNPKAHGFNVEPWSPVAYDTFTVEGGVSFSQVSKALGVPEDSLALLNPGLIRGITPPSHDLYTLNIPQGSRDRFQAAYATIERSYQAPQPQRFVHRVRGKETLAGIAGRYGVSVADLKRWNHIRGRKVRAGRTLVVYGDVPGLGGGRVGSLVEPPLARRGDGSLPEPSRQLSHKVRRGETVAAIASRYGVSPDDVKQWNGLSGKRLKAGQRLWVSAPTAADQDAFSRIARTSTSASTSANPTQDESDSSAIDDAPAAPATTARRHRVHSGETLSSIARRYGVSTRDLKQWNGLSGKRLRAGQVLRVVDPDQDRDDNASKPAAPRTAARSGSDAGDQPVVRHRVHRGETISSIAHRYGVTVQQIREWNGLASDRLHPGAKLRVGGGSPGEGASSRASAKKEADAPPPQKQAKAGGTDDPTERVHVVRSGETLESIAQHYSVAVSSLRILNRLKSTRISVGQKLVVPGAAAPRPEAREARRDAPKVRTISYTVRPGDSLYSIARAQATTVDSIVRLNGLKGRGIKPGQVLQIPLASR